MGYSVTRSRPCLSEGSSHHGADSVHLVPGDRPQSAEICSQYLPSPSRRLRPRSPPHLLLPCDAVASRAAGHAVKAAQNSCENEATLDARDFQLCHAELCHAERSEAPAERSRSTPCLRAAPAACGGISTTARRRFMDSAGAGAGPEWAGSLIFWNHKFVRSQPMCRNIKTLFNFDPPVTEDEVRAASLQFVRKITGFNKPSKANEAAFAAAIEDVAAISGRLLRSLETNAPPKNREEEAAKAKARAAERFSA